MASVDQNFTSDHHLKQIFPLNTRWLTCVLPLLLHILDRLCADSSFVAVLYTSDSDKIMRYTDEGEIHELCKWTVDLSSLPTFQQNASYLQHGGFYTGRRTC